MHPWFIHLVATRVKSELHGHNKTCNLSKNDANKSMRRDHITLAKLVSDGFFKEALSLFSHLLSSPSPTLHSFTFPTLFKACTNLRSPSHTQTLHAHLLKIGFHSDPYASSALTSAYAANPRHFLDALKVFNEMHQPSDASLNAALSGSSVPFSFFFVFLL